MEGTITILVVDDDVEIANLVKIHLLSEGYQVFQANSAREGLTIMETEPIQLAILDIMMPGMNGIEMCEAIRKTSNIPIIMLSAKSDDIDKIKGLSSGADDYVIKPFNPLELIARVKSQLRRYTQFNQVKQEKQKDDMIQLEHIMIEKQAHRVIAYGKEIKLTPIEFDILYLLASHLGQVFSTEEIFKEVWKETAYEANNTVMVHIRRLREKIEMDTRNAQIIKTVWGVGYKIEK